MRSPDQVATCFLAQYSRAHKLPSDLLQAKGLYGCLLEQFGQQRFFTPAEVASLHCAVLPVILGPDRHLTTKLLGNCITTVHAAFSLLHGCIELGCQRGVSCEQVEAQCLSLRLQASNSAFLPINQDWVLCHSYAAPALLKSLGCCEVSFYTTITARNVQTPETSEA